jgi:chromosome segregation ATPase
MSTIMSRVGWGLAVLAIAGAGWQYGLAYRADQRAASAWSELYVVNAKLKAAEATRDAGSGAAKAANDRISALEAEIKTSRDGAAKATDAQANAEKALQELRDRMSALEAERDKALADAKALASSLAKEKAARRAAEAKIPKPL